MYIYKTINYEISKKLENLFCAFGVHRGGREVTNCENFDYVLFLYLLYNLFIYLSKTNLTDKKFLQCN